VILDYHHRSCSSSDHFKFSIHKHLDREGSVLNCASWAAEISSASPGTLMAMYVEYHNVCMMHMAGLWVEDFK
jgi:hypothetical protein